MTSPSAPAPGAARRAAPWFIAIAIGSLVVVAVLVVLSLFGVGDRGPT